MNRNRDDNQLIVTFYDSDQHTVLKKEYVDKCGSATPPKDPTRPGKTFAGWVGRYEEVACNENVYATYNDIDYVVTFKSHDGIILKTQHVAYGGSAKEPPIIPVWEGHSFTGWDKPFSYITEDTVVTALYDANTIKLTFVKYKDEEEPWFDVDIPVGTSYTLPDPEDGDVAWSFDYWVGNKDIYTQDTTIIARYKDAEETNYTYEFYEPLPGGQWAKITSFEHSGNIAWEDLYEEFVEDKIGVSTAFYKLLGWAETQGSKEKINDDKVFSGGRFYAIIKELPYEIQFVEYELEDGDYQEYKAIVNCKAGEAFNVPDFNTDPTFKKYEGLTFKQWEPFYTSSNVDYFRRGVKTFNLPTTATSGLQEDDRVYMTYQARFENKIYKVTFVNYDYSLVKEFYCEYGHSVPDADVPQPTKKPNPDAIFTGWIGSWKNVIQDTVIIAGFGETPRHEVKYYANRTYGPFTGSTPTLLYTDIVEDGQPSSYTADEDIKNSMVYQNRTGNTSSWTFGNWKYEDGTDADLSEVTEDKVVYLDATPVTVTVKWLAKVIDPSNPFAQWEPVYNYKVLNNTLYTNADRYNAVSPESDDWSYYFNGPVTYETEYYKHSDGNPFDPTQGVTEQIDCKVIFTPASYSINYYAGTDQIIGSGSIPDVTLSNTSADNLVSTDSITVNDDLIPYSGSSKNITGYNFLGWTLTKGSTTIDLPSTGAVWLQQFVNNKGITGTVINLYAVYEAKTFSSFDVFSFDGTLENIPGPDGAGSMAASLNSLSNVVYGIELSDLLNYVRFNYDKTSLKIATESAKRSLSPGWKKCNINGTLGYFYIYAANDTNPYAGWPTVPFVCPFRILSFLKSEDGDYYWTSTDLTKHVGDTIDLTEYAAETPLHKDWRVTLGYNASLFEKVTVGTNPNCYKRDAEDFLLNCDEIVDDNYVITRQNPDFIYIIENKNFGEDESTLQFFYDNLISENNANTYTHYFADATTEVPLDEDTDWNAITPREPNRIRNLSQNKAKNADNELIYIYDYVWMILLSKTNDKFFIKNLDDLTDSEKQAIIDDGNAAAFWLPGVIKEDPTDHTRTIKGWGHFYYTRDNVTWENFDPDADIRFAKVYEDSSSSELSDFYSLVSRNSILGLGYNPFGVTMLDNYTIRDQTLGYGAIFDVTSGALKSSSNVVNRSTLNNGDGTFSGLFSWNTDKKNIFESFICFGIITSEQELNSDGKLSIEYDVNETTNNIERTYDKNVINGILSYTELDRNGDLFCVKTNYFNPEDSEQYISKIERRTVLNIPISSWNEYIVNSSPYVDINIIQKNGNTVGLPDMRIYGIDTKYNSTVATTGTNITSAINRFVVYYAGRDHVFDICIPAGGFFAPKALAPDNANYGFLDIVWEDFRTHEEVDSTYITNFNRTLGDDSSVAYIFVAKSFRIGAKLFLTRNDLGYRGFDEIYSRVGINICQSIQTDKWKVLPTDNMTPCILYDFNHTVEENMNDPWIIAGNSSYTFYNLPFVKSSSFYNSLNESINGNGFSHSVNAPFNDLASGICFKQKYNIINNWKNVDFERVWTSFNGVKRSDYKNIVGNNELFRIPIGAEKIYDSALYYYQYNAKPMEESHLSEDAIDSWKSEVNPIAIPGNITEDDYIIDKNNCSIEENPAAYYCYKNNIKDYDYYSPVGYDASYSLYMNGNEEGESQYYGIINTQCDTNSIYHSGGSYIWGIYEQNRFRWYKDYNACLSIFEETVDNLDMSEYESGIITNSNYVDNSTSNYISFSATTTSTVIYNSDNIKTNFDIPRVEFNYNIYREVSTPRSFMYELMPGGFITTTHNKRDTNSLCSIPDNLGKWGFHRDIQTEFDDSILFFLSISFCSRMYLLIDNSTKIVTKPTSLRSYLGSSGHRGGIVVNPDYTNIRLNGLYYQLPVTTAYTELFEYAMAQYGTSIDQFYCSFNSGKLAFDSTVNDIINYPNAIVNNNFSHYNLEDDDFSSLSINESDEDLPGFYTIIDYRNSLYLKSESDGLFLTRNTRVAVANSSELNVLNGIGGTLEFYKGCYDIKYLYSSVVNRQSLITIYLAKGNSSLGTAPASWGSPSGGVTGFTNEPNQQLRESIGLTTDFEINWSEKFKENLLSTTESAIFVNRYSFTVNIYKKSDNKKLAHYTSIGDNLNPCLLIGVARKYEGTAVRRFGWRDAGNFYIPIDENYITEAMNNGLIRNGSSAVEGTDYVFIPMSDLNNGDTIDFTIDGVTYTCELSRKLFTAADKFSLYTKNIDYSFSNVE